MRFPKMFRMTMSWTVQMLLQLDLPLQNGKRSRRHPKPNPRPVAKPKQRRLLLPPVMKQLQTRPVIAVMTVTKLISLRPVVIAVVAALLRRRPDQNCAPVPKSVRKCPCYLGMHTV